jgi:hypothetical protein
MLRKAKDRPATNVELMLRPTLIEQVNRSLSKENEIGNVNTHVSHGKRKTKLEAKLKYMASM